MDKCRCPTCNSLFDGKFFYIKIGNLHNTIIPVKYPSPFAMEDWINNVRFPKGSINKNTNIFIQDENTKNFEKIII